MTPDELRARPTSELRHLYDHLGSWRRAFEHAPNEQEAYRQDIHAVLAERGQDPDGTCEPTGLPAD
jgi:hypothetical protein